METNKLNKHKGRHRSIFFVCSAIINNNLISETLEASQEEDAQNIFKKKYEIFPQIVTGPFYKKKIYHYADIDIDKTEIILSSEIKKAEFNGWIVNATFLKNPKDYAFLLFDHRIDGQKIQKPQGMKIVAIKELKLL